MNTKALRQKVLDLAIHGKLVPQNPNDESAEVLLKKIREEKAEKIKKGELKADKKDSFIFVGSDKRHYEQFADGTVKNIEDEIPFEVPDGWAWCRLTNVAITELGKTLDARKNKGEPYDYLCALNVKWYTFDFTTLKQIRLEDKEKERYLVRKGDLLICEGGDVGRAAIWESENPIYYQNALHRVRFYQNINQYFFLHVLNYYKNLGLIDDVSGGVTIKHFTQNSMQKLLFPLPSLAEQDRMVSVIKNIFFQIEVLEQNKSELQDAIKQTKSKILDLAIHGKLVPQDPNDEPAEELLKRIATSDNRPYEKVEEEPFEIPDSWKWIKLNDLAEIARGGSPRPIQDYITEDKNGINWIKIGDTSEESKYITSAKEKIKPEGKRHSRFVHAGDFLLTNSMSFGRPYILKIDGCIHDGWLVFANIKEYLLQDYLYYALSSAYIYETFSNVAAGSTVKNLKSDTVKQVNFPLPPLPEQQRIVEAIENMYEVLDQIQNNLI